MINGIEGPGSLLIDGSFRYQLPINRGIESIDLFYDIFNLLNRTNHVPPTGNRVRRRPEWQLPLARQPWRRGWHRRLRP